MNKKAILFDLWNTLIEKQGKNISSIIAEYFKFDKDEVHEWIRVSSVSKNKKTRYSVYENLCLANDTKFTYKDQKFIDEVFSTYIKECRWIQNAKETLVKVKSKGYKIGIVSNTTHLSHKIIEDMGIKELVDDVTFSCDVGYLKPDPRIFKAALKKLQLSNDDVIMVGDKIATDVLGAKIMQMDVILFKKDKIELKNDTIMPNTSLKGGVNDIFDILKIIN